MSPEGRTETEIGVSAVEGKNEVVDGELKHCETLTEELRNSVNNGEQIVLESRSKFDYGDKERERGLMAF